MNHNNGAIIDKVDDILDLIESSHRIAISAHAYPDGDAVGSSIAMAGFLGSQGKDVTVLLPKNDIGPVRVLDGFDEIVDPDDYDFSVLPDLFVCLDCADPSRICDARIRGWTVAVPTLNIDHHGKEIFGTRNYVVKDASSTGELVYDIAKAAGWEIRLKAAEALWCSVITDTGRFSSPSTTPSTLRCAADLAGKGVRISLLAEKIYQCEPFKAFDLRRRAINTLDRWNGGRVAVISLTPEDFAETGCMKHDGETFPEIPNSLEGVQLAVFFYPFPIADAGHTRISIRSRPGSPVTARALATEFGGAGHEHSAAATLPLAVADARRAVRDCLARTFR